MIPKLPQQERPRERCLKFGPQVLSLRECLALLIGSGPPGIGCMGLANSLVQEAGISLFQSIASENYHSLKKVKGLGPAKQAQLLAAFELCRRYHLHFSDNVKKPTNKKLNDKVLYKIPWSYKIDKKEWVGFVPIYSDGKVGEFVIVAHGGPLSVVFTNKELFKKLLGYESFGFVLIHNHPSGLLEASEDDERVTDKLKFLSRLLGVQFFDHLIVHKDRFFVVNQ